MTDEQYAILEDIWRDLQTLKAAMDKTAGRPVTHPVSEVPLLDPLWDYTDDFDK